MTVLDFKRRLRQLIRINGSQKDFADEMEKYPHRRSRKVTEELVSKWIGENYTELPDAEDMLIIAQIEDEVSLDYLFGRADARRGTVEERIERRVRKMGT